MSDESRPSPQTLNPSGLDKTAAAAPRPEVPHLEPGSTVGRYRITEELGAGGMGVVYCAWDSALHRKVALKVIKTRTNEISMLARFEREARAMAQLSHRSVVGVHDFGVHEGQPYLVMELVQGTSLRSWLGAKKRPWREVLGALLQAAHGLGAAHRAGLVHRDFKPDNVLVGIDGRVAVTDFGLARPFDEALQESVPSLVKAGTSLSTPLTVGAGVLGTPLYMAPEQFLGSPTDARTDLFAFGVVLYEALYGLRPFPFKQPTEPVTLDTMLKDILNGKLRAPPGGRGVPRRFLPVIEKLLKPELAQRPASMDEVVAALELASGTPRLPGLLAATAVAALLVFGVLPHFAPAETSRVPAAHVAWLEAMAQFRGGSTLLAQRSLKRVVELDPSFSTGQLWAAFLNPDRERARAQLAQVVSRRDHLRGPTVAFFEAVSPGLMPLPDLDAWLATVDRLVSRQPRQANLLLVRAQVHSQRGEVEAALADLREVARLDPTMAVAAAARRGALEQKRRNFDAARAAWDECLALRASAVDCLAGRIRAESARGQCVAMERDARAWRAIDPEDGDARSELAFALQANGSWAAAREVLETPAASDVDDPYRWIDAYSIAAMEADFETAGRIAQNAVEASAGAKGVLAHFAPNILLLKALTESGELDRAARLSEDMLQRAEAWTPETVKELSLFLSFLKTSEVAGKITHDEFRKHRDDLLARIARSAAATGTLDDVAKNQPWLIGYAATSRTKQDALEALDALDRFQPLPAPGVRATDSDLAIGTVFVLADQPNRAIPYLESVMRSCNRIEPPMVWPIGLLRLGQARLGLGDRTGASAAWKQLLTLWKNPRPRSLHAEEAAKALTALGSE